MLALALCSACGEGAAAKAEGGSLGATAEQVGQAREKVGQARDEAIPWKRMAEAWVHPNPLPSFPLVDHEGRAFHLGRLRDSHVLVGLIFTHCSIPEACPLTTQKMHEVGKLWRAKEEAGETEDRRLRLLTLTFDPEADTPEVLKSYSELVRKDVPDWLFATGETELLEETLPRMFGVLAGKKDADGNIAHSVKVALLRPGLRSVHTWTDNAFEPEEVVALVLR